MSYLLADDSPKRQAAMRFGAELRRALESRELGVKQLEKAIGTKSHTQLHWYLNGRNLPRLRQATVLAEALAWPALADIIREARTKVCARDGRAFVDEGGPGNKRFCSARCREAAGRDRARLHHMQSNEAAGYQANEPDRVLVARLEQELERVRPGTRALSRREVRDALAQYRRAAPQGRVRQMEGQLEAHLTAVEAMCRSCEPEGLCRNEECPLRSVSPLPYVPMRDVGLAEKALGRWAQPGARDEAARAKRAWWEDLSPARRAEIVRRMVARRHRKHRERPGVPREQCGCPVSRGTHVDDCPLAEVAS